MNLGAHSRGVYKDTEQTWHFLEASILAIVFLGNYFILIPTGTELNTTFTKILKIATCEFKKISCLYLTAMGYNTFPGDMCIPTSGFKEIQLDKFESSDEDHFVGKRCGF